MKLIFVYNAQAGRANSFVDSVRKIIQPQAYPCSLCELTHGVFFEKSAWKAFRKSSITNMVFMHKDEFRTQYRSKWLPKYDFPIVLLQDTEGLHPFVTSEELKYMQTVTELITILKKRSN